MEKVRKYGVPYVDNGRAHLFTEAALVQLQEAMTCRSISKPRGRAGRATGTFGVLTTGSRSTEVQEALTAALQRRRSQQSSGRSKVVPLPRSQDRHGRTP